MAGNHGGRRSGSGRKRLFEGPKTTVACPKELSGEVRSMIANMIEFRSLSGHPGYAGKPVPEPRSFSRPLALTAVPAGFPSPADDYIDTQLDLNDFFVLHPSASFYWKVSGESMNLAGILDGSIVLIDRSLLARHNDIVLATVSGDVTVKRFVHEGGHYELRPETTGEGYRTLKFQRADDIEIWGVVSAVFNKFR